MSLRVRAGKRLSVSSNRLLHVFQASSAGLPVVLVSSSPLLGNAPNGSKQLPILANTERLVVRGYSVRSVATEILKSETQSSKIVHFNSSVQSTSED